MGQAGAKLHKQNGSLTFHGNTYHCPWMSQEANRKVIVRFDPEDLHSGVHIYGGDGGHLGFAECQQKVGFFDLEGARSTARRRRQIVKAEKALQELHRPIATKDIAASMRGHEAQTPADLAAKVVKPVFARPAAATSFREHNSPAAEAAQDALIVEMSSAKQKRAPKPALETFTVAKEPDARFRQALEIQQRQRAGEPVGEREAGWLENYVKHPEFEARIELHKSFGGSTAG
jgi:hypothetical protein